MGDTPIQPGKYYHLGKFRFEHQLNGRWGVDDSMRGVGNCRTPVGALLRYWRAPHVTVRVQGALSRLRLYRPTMKVLHQFGQCFMVTEPGPDSLRRECTWCGTKARPTGGRYDRCGTLPSARDTVYNDTGDPIPVSTEDHVRHGLDHIRDRYGSSKDGN